jgi:hypothetical protein
LIQRALAVGGVAIAVAGVRLLDIAVGNAGIGKRGLPRLLGPVGIVAFLRARLVELGHADTDHVGAVAVRAHTSVQFLSSMLWRGELSAAIAPDNGGERYRTGVRFVRFST